MVDMVNVGRRKMRVMGFMRNMMNSGVWEWCRGVIRYGWWCRWVRNSVARLLMVRLRVTVEVVLMGHVSSVEDLSFWLVRWRWLRVIVEIVVTGHVSSVEDLGFWLMRWWWVEGWLLMMWRWWLVEGREIVVVTRWWVMLFVVVTTVVMSVGYVGGVVIEGELHFCDSGEEDGACLVLKLDFDFHFMLQQIHDGVGPITA